MKGYLLKGMRQHSQLWRSPKGPLSAPAFLNMMLQQKRHNENELSFLAAEKERKHECEKQKNHRLLLNKTIIVLFNLRTRRAFNFTAANKTKK